MVVVHRGGRPSADKNGQVASWFETDDGYSACSWLHGWETRRLVCCLSWNRTIGESCIESRNGKLITFIDGISHDVAYVDGEEDE